MHCAQCTRVDIAIRECDDECVDLVISGLQVQLDDIRPHDHDRQNRPASQNTPAATPVSMTPVDCGETGLVQSIARLLRVRDNGMTVREICRTLQPDEPTNRSYLNTEVRRSLACSGIYVTVACM